MPLSLDILRILTPLRAMKRSESSLPTEVQTDVPSCAQQCVATSIQQYLGSGICSNSTDLSCLCSHYSSEGMTLGEISLICLNSNCPKQSLNASVSSSAYDVCAGQTKAVTATHTILTSFETATQASVTVSQTVTPSSSSSSPASSSVPSTKGSVSEQSSTLKTVTRSSATDSSIFSTITAAPSLTTSGASTSDLPNITTTTPFNSNSTSSIGSTPTAAAEPHKLTSGQAVGASVGAIGAAGVLLAFFFCCFCVRRKKQKRNKDSKQNKHHRSFDFVDKSPAAHSSFPPYAYGPQGRQTQNGGYMQQTERVERDSLAPPRNPFEPNAPVTTIITHPAPVYRPITLWPAPKPGMARSKVTKARDNWKPPRPPRSPRPRDSSATACTMFEEDKTPRQKSFLGVPPSPGPLIPARHRPNLKLHYAEKYTLSPNEMYHPDLSLKIPPVPVSTIHEHHKSSPTQLTPDSASTTRGQATRLSMPPSSAISYLPSYYTSADSRTPIVPSRSPYELGQVYDYPMPPPKPNAPKTPHMSYSSDTTDFESVDPEEVTPPEETDDKRLSAVAESPVSCVRYPKVPRPSNQAIPRSPPTVSRWTASSTAFSPSSAYERQRQYSDLGHTGFSSPSSDTRQAAQPTLLAKRRGEDVQQDLEQRLRIGGNGGGSDSGRGASYGGVSSIYSQTSTLNNGMKMGEDGSPLRGKAGGFMASSLASPSSLKGRGHEWQKKQQQLSPEILIKSPLWEPELTPSKRGDDLFLSVH